MPAKGVIHVSRSSVSANDANALPSPKPAYRRDIDGLRAVAVTSVVFYHAGLWPLNSGYVGVDIFFVISGFLIGGILNRETRAGTFTFAGFYARRARRILPALIAVVTIVSLLSIMLMGARELRQTGLSAGTALVGISNIYFWWSTNYFAPSAHLNPFLMTWSLGVEEQFYVFFPFLLILLTRRSQQQAAATIGILSALSFIVCIVATAYYPTAAFYLLPMRAWELGAGALLALLWAHPARPTSAGAHNMAGAIGLAIVVASCVLFDDATPFPGVTAALPVSGALALILAERSWVNRHLLSSAPMVAIGLLSYSWYLWHAPLMALVRLVHFGPASVTLMCAVAIVSLLCAYLSWRFVERPFRHGAHDDGATLRRYGVALGACLALPAIFALSQGLPQRLGDDGRAVESTLAQGRGNPCLVSYGAVEPSHAAACRPAKQEARPTAILLGDSHAGALGTAIAKIARQQRVGFAQYEKSSCAPLLGATRAMPKYPDHAAECAAFNEAMFKRIAADHSIGTVVLAGFWSGSFQGEANDGLLVTPGGSSVKDQAALLRSALTDTIRRYQAAGKRVIVIADVPLFRFDPGKEIVSDLFTLRSTLRTMLGSPDDVSDGRAAKRWLRPVQAGDSIVADVARGSPGVTYFEPSRQLCDASRCAYGDKLPYYIDFQHLSRPGAEQALKGLKL